jgi:hypothetical protein
MAFEATSQVAIESVSHARERKDGEGDPIVKMPLGVEGGNQRWDQDDPADCQHIGNVATH